ncbi:MAG: polyphosphate kinase 1, partial [Bacteroidetes bacterium]|nr:polyphosphate kinase 1 [Bacteroidota bacterium]
MIIPRDRSWVSFNERVLQEAADRSNPLYERIKFLAIFSSNLDEFYRVRIAKLRQYKLLRKSLRPKMEEKPSRLIREINEVVVLQQKWYGDIYRNDILPSLRKEGIFLKSSEEYSEKEACKIDSFFEKVLKPEIKIYYLDGEIPFLEDKALYLFGYDGNRAVLINIPEESDRFVELISEPDFLSFSYVDDIVRYKAKTLFEDPSERFFSIKLSRDVELYLDEDDLSQELVQQIADKIASRNSGLATRLLYDTNMPSSDLVYLQSKLHINEVDLMPGGRYHNMNDLFSLPKPEGKSHLFNKPLPPLPHPELCKSDDLLDFVRENEVLLSVPYQSFEYVIELIHKAANDPNVHSISITLYRLSQDSKVAKALLDAVLKGKKVVAFIEAKARFDEKNNIYWGTKLKEAGATVLYSMPYIKVHSKIMLIESDEGSVSYVGTGNFSEKNAKLYTDFFYITHRMDVASD